MRLNWWRASAPAPSLDLALLPAPRASSTASFTGILPALDLAGATGGSALAAWASEGRLVTADLGDTVGSRRGLSPGVGPRPRDPGGDGRRPRGGGPGADGNARGARRGPGRERRLGRRGAHLRGRAAWSAVPPPAVGVAASGDAVAYWSRVVAGVTVVERATFDAG